jgi:hypothetical protein
MDPLRAIGLASDILSFIDFSFKLIGGSHRLLNSANGLTPENCRLCTVVEDLKVATERIVYDLPGNTQKDQQLSDRLILIAIQDTPITKAITYS